MRLILVRHGQTACNVQDVWHDWDDCDLTETGRQQAAATATRLAGERLDAVYSSDTPRARQTAAAIAAPHRLMPILDPGLRERHAGEFEGVPIPDVLARHPTVWDDRAADFWGWRPPGGESFHEVLTRALAVVERLQAEHDGGTVAVVTHMGVTRALISHLAGMSLAGTYDLPFPSTGVSIFTLEGDAVQVETLNDASHVG